MRFRRQTEPTRYRLLTFNDESVTHYLYQMIESWSCTFICEYHVIDNTLDKGDERNKHSKNVVLSFYYSDEIMEGQREPRCAIMLVNSLRHETFAGISRY